MSDLDFEKITIKRKPGGRTLFVMKDDKEMSGEMGMDEALWLVIHILLGQRHQWLFPVWKARGEAEAFNMFKGELNE